MKKIFFLCIFCLSFSFLLAQNRNSVSVTNRNEAAFNLTKIYRAGMEAEAVTDESQWLNYSVKTNAEDPFQSVAVSIASGSIPPGIEVFLEAGNESGKGWGKTGNPTGKIKLSNLPTVLISEIGTCETGKGKNKGHKLTMTIMVVDYAKIQPGDFNIYLQYTLQ